MKHLCIATIAVVFSTGQVAAQYGPEEIGAEESPIVDPDIETDESSEEDAEATEGERKARGCAVGPSSSDPSPAPIQALLFALGIIAFRRLRRAP